MDGSPKEGPLSRMSTRRRVIAGAGALAAGGTAALTLLPHERKEQLKPIPGSIVMIDFVSDKPIEGVKQTQQITERDFVKTLLGDKYIEDSLIRAEFGEDFHSRLPDVFKKYPENALVYAATKEFLGTKVHGQLVAEVIQTVLKDTDSSPNLTIVPLQNAFNPQSVTFMEDDPELENKGFSVTVDQKRIIEMLKKSPQKIVNISFQIGDEEAYFIQRERQNGQIVDVSKPYPFIKPAYAKGKSEKNLPRVFEICRAYPDKLFVIAGGNFGDFLMSSDSRPDNLLLVAEWNQDKSTQNVYAADVYVDNRKHGLSNGSSFSTATISAYASILERKGFSIAQIRTKILEASDETEYNQEGYDVTASVFDPEKLKSVIK